MIKLDNFLFKLCQKINRSVRKYATFHQNISIAVYIQNSQCRRLKEVEIVLHNLQHVLHI